MKVRVHCFVSGLVQGVSFRSYVREIGIKLDLTGWVKNLSGGRVEAMAEGEEKDVERFLELLKRGSILSRVDEMQTKKEKYEGSLLGFKIIL